MQSKTTLALLAVMMVSVASACQKLTEFNACVDKEARSQADCNAAVESTPDFKYWDCVCQAQRRQTSCYALCPDDENMQLQYRSNQASAENTCSYVDQQKAIGADAPEAEKTTVLAGNKTVSAIKPKTRVLPKLNTTTKAAGTGIRISDSSAPVANYSFLYFTVLSGVMWILMIL
jgi:hypothetical protein